MAEHGFQNGLDILKWYSNVKKYAYNCTHIHTIAVNYIHIQYYTTIYNIQQHDHNLNASICFNIFSPDSEIFQFLDTTFIHIQTYKKKKTAHMLNFNVSICYKSSFFFFKKYIKVTSFIFTFFFFYKKNIKAAFSFF